MLGHMSFVGAGGWNTSIAELLHYAAAGTENTAASSPQPGMGSANSALDATNMLDSQDLELVPPMSWPMQ